MSDADEAPMRQQAVAEIVRGVARKTVSLVIAAAAAASALSLLRNIPGHWWFIPASVLFGGALGMLNFRWLAKAVERVYLRQGATPGLSNLAAAVISILKLAVIFIILFIVIKWRVVHVFGMVGGLSLCFLAILWEGAMLTKRTYSNGGTMNRHEQKGEALKSREERGL